MTDKEKQIAEMAKMIHYDYWGSCSSNSCFDCRHSELNICIAKIIAEKFYEQGYRKIPEGSVVLSLQEHENDIYAAYNRGYRSGSKETAREFAKRAKEKLYAPHRFREDDDIIDEITKQFGVEVK